MSLLSVSWDLRVFWASLPMAAHVYLLLLTSTGFVTLCVTIKICLSLRNHPHDRVPESNMVRFRNAIFHLRRAFGLLLLAFGVLLSDMIFQSARALERYRHLDVDAGPPFDGPAGLSFIVFTAFFAIFCLLWYVEFKIQSLLDTKVLPQT